MAGKTHLALATGARQRVQFAAAESFLLIGADQFGHVAPVDIAQQIIGLDKMIAGASVAVMLHGKPVTAGRIEDAHAG